MQLEKILEEIDNLRGLVGGEDNYINMYVKKTWDDCLDMVQDIIRKHMNDGWIPVEERLPDIGQRVIATIKHHAWISDYDSDWVPESEKSRHQEYTESCEAVLGYGGSWKYRCKEDDYMEDRAYINPEKNIAVPVSEVIAWRPLPEPYRPERRAENESRTDKERNET